MEERIYVRVDEEKPSDERMAVRLVEAKTTNEEKNKLDMILNKLDTFAGMNVNLSADVLREIKNILSGLHTSIASVERKYVDLSDNVQNMKSKIGVEYGEKEFADRRIKEDMENVKTSLDNTTAAIGSFDRKYYDVYEGLQNIKAKLDSQDGDDLENIKVMIGDLMAAMSALGRKYEAVSESLHASIEGKGEADRIISDIENLQSTVTGQAVSESQKLDDIQKLIEAKAPDTVIEGAIDAGLADIKSSLVSELDNNYSSVTDQIGEYKEVAKKMEQIKKSVTSTGTKMSKSQAKMNKTIDNFNSYLLRLNSVDYMLRLLNAKELLKTKKKLPKWATDKKKVLSKLIDGLEEEITDIVIVNTIPKEGMTLTALSKAAGKSSKKTKLRVNQMIANGFMEARKIKKKTIYFLKR